jgi:hypothetical protein
MKQIKANEKRVRYILVKLKFDSEKSNTYPLQVN